MDKQQILEKIVEMPSNYMEEEEELKLALIEVCALNELQNDLSNIIGIQGENIEKIDKISEKVSETTQIANKELEAASGRKFKMLPIFLGTGIGVAITLPVTLGLGLSAGIVGGAVAGGSVLGGILGKTLAK